jgi:hypothetical protein
MAAHHFFWGVNVMITIFGDFSPALSEKIGVFHRDQCKDPFF